ncbi:hypothetical protein OH76DRAFT_306923 [Lentinus brumalis]|uniref:Uncharacterized protein n=1 Tax=Lentinus brumalis TaxID=2498619 RepID=A0A371CKE5_9APHY|nr:hypothetical protein OH76DRAFT_306923 [Polyporus brumalis]
MGHLAPLVARYITTPREGNLRLRAAARRHRVLRGAASAERAAPHADLALSKCSDRDFCLGCALTSATAVQFGVPFQNVSLVAFFTEP